MRLRHARIGATVFGGGKNACGAAVFTSDWPAAEIVKLTSAEVSKYRVCRECWKKLQETA